MGRPIDLDYNKNYYQKNKKRIDKQNRANYKQHRERYLHQKWVGKLRIKYGLTEQDYNDMKKLQSHRCGICRGFKKGKNGHGELNHFHVDHDHKTHKVRGLLCSACNRKLGWYEACQERIENYLKNN